MVIHVQNQVLAHDGQTDQRNISSSFHKFILKSDFQPSLIQGMAASEFLDWAGDVGIKVFSLAFSISDPTEG
jgi:hypothetical protein